MAENKVLVVYYSLDRDCDLIARDLQEITGADLERLYPESEPHGKGFGKIFIGAFTARIGLKVRIRPLKHKIEDYNTIIIVSPVWAGTFPPAIGTFLKKEHFTGKDVHLLASSGSGEASKMLEQMKMALSGNNILLDLSLKSPLADPDRTKQKLEEFCLAFF